MQTHRGGVVRSAVMSGVGIGFPPTWLFGVALARDDRQVLQPDWPAPAAPVRLTCPNQGRQSAQAKAFADHLAPAIM